MTTSFKHRLMMAALLAASGAAHAGSPDGLRIAAIAAASGQPYTGALKQLIADHRADKVADCNRYLLNVANMYFTHLPPQMTGDLAVAAVSDQAKRKQLARLLTRYRDATLTTGFDAALAYEVKDGRLRLYGLSGDAGEKVLMSSLTLDEARDQKKFNVAVCRAVAGLGVLTAP